MAATRDVRRILLGGRTTLLTQQRTYRTADYLEIDNVEGSLVRRRRIFYDEILLVTLHSTHAWTAAAAIALSALGVGLMGFALPAINQPVAVLVWVLTLTTLTIGGIVAVTTPVRVVTIFGRRARTQMRFWSRGGRGREAFGLVCRLAQAAQTRPARTAAQNTLLSDGGRASVD